MPARTRRAVQIRAQRGRALTLGKPTVNIKGIEVETIELKPKSDFLLKLTFQTGFLIPKGKEVVVTVPTGFPDFPTIKIQRVG